MEISGSQSIECVVMRGGTTRGFFFRPDDLPHDPKVRDDLLVSIVAGQDSQQADGLGGRDMLLSKVAMVWNSDGDSSSDVECKFGVITPGSSRVKYGSNCGNLVSAVALYSIEEGLCKKKNGTIRIFNPDSNKRVEARLLDNGTFLEDCRRLKSIGMPKTGTAIELAFLDPIGTINRGLLPTGKPTDRLLLESGAEINVSIIDSGAVYVFVSAADLGLDCVTPAVIESQAKKILRVVEHLRGQAAVLCGLVESSEDARRLSPAVPKVALVSPAQSYSIKDGEKLIEETDIDLHARIVSNQSLHNAYAVTGAVATISGAVVPGSILNYFVSGLPEKSPFSIRIGHPSGIIEPRVDWLRSNKDVVINKAYMVRTARRLLNGVSYFANVIDS